ncbi:hypothetical protein FACS1894190_03620 [Spirochaetia bacterium]|nr:hypothetical protein FACS1894190_03620 [Spirochaetia bacterium]
MRKLASIQVIHGIAPIQNADAIELVSVLGWKVVVKKDQFKNGDRCVYIEIDSVVPYETNSAFAFMAERKGRVRTIKLRGQVSQGIVFPLDALGIDQNIEIGTDVTEQLGITKFEDFTAANTMDAEGHWPGYLCRSDQERLQNFDDGRFADLKNHLWELTCKVDGTSITLSYYKGEIKTCSRNLAMKRVDGSFYKYLEDQWHIITNLTAYCEQSGLNIAIQGEHIGPKVQGNYYGLNAPAWKIFDIWDIDRQLFVTPSERYKLLDAMKLTEFCTPLIGRNFDLSGFSMDQLIEMADGESLIAKGKNREGIVWKAEDDGMLHFKTVSNKYLLKTQRS